jgi:two-component system, cell cycle sensor histidine kinase and response regulator CckA
MLSLVVDDDERIRAYIQAILHGENFESLEAEDGEQALELMQMIDGGVDLIITDIQMSGGGGLPFARAVSAAYPSVPVILVSGYCDPEAGFEFVQKPFSWSLMSRVIRRVMSRAA